jgi:cytochrome oxidase Cu insertion factor (SCO1/SenC/PrrC family)
MRLVWLARVTVVAVAAAGAIGAAAARDMLQAAGQWLDDQGQPYHLEALYGAPTVITMAYGACRRVCSTSMRMMEEVQRLADARHLALNFVVIGLDPLADRPEDWAQLRAERHLERPNWHFLTGDEASIRQLARRLGVRYWRYGEHTLHDLRIVLLSAQAQPLKSIDAFDQAAETLLP